MQRDLGNEVIVAIAAVAVLAFAITFGILLSLSDRNDDLTATPGGVMQGMLNRTPSVAPVPENTQDEGDILSRTAPTSSASISATSTPAPVVMTQTPSSTPVTLTEIPTETLTPTVRTRVPSQTPPVKPTTTEDMRPVLPTRPSPSALSTQTAALASMTPTRTPTAVIPILPTLTARPTITPAPTFTLTFTRTLRPSPASATATPTSIRPTTTRPTPSTLLTPSPIVTRPTATSDLLPTPVTPAPATTSPAMVVVPTLSITPREVCAAPAGWHPYIVQPNDTLFSLARAASSTVSALSAANCLNDVDRILAGDVLFLPRPLLIVPPAIGQPPPAGLERLGCVSPVVQISSPSSGQRVSGVFVLVGTATLPNFEYYKIEVRSGLQADYNFIERYNHPVENAELGQINTMLFAPGLYWVRLVVVDNTGNVPDIATCVVPLYFE